ncbi:MAG TPA: hypothetical protein VG122_03795 [Gemmata sp.]|jgi:bifunctional ADP-heptose synthase (sugar kinase/adenylyltransferase)|nr:hypothetical protein [Gemmata sp.]
MIYPRMRDISVRQRRVKTNWGSEPPDTAAAALTLALAAGASIKDAVKIANAAAGLVVGKMRTAVVGFAELREKFATSEPVEVIQVG